MLSHPAYVRALAGHRVTLPVRRSDFCTHLGKELQHIHTCKAENPHHCDELGEVVIHNRDCQGCGSFVGVNSPPP